MRKSNRRTNRHRGPLTKGLLGLLVIAFASCTSYDLLTGFRDNLTEFKIVLEGDESIVEQLLGDSIGEIYSVGMDLEGGVETVIADSGSLRIEREGGLIVGNRTVGTQEDGTPIIEEFFSSDGVNVTVREVDSRILDCADPVIPDIDPLSLYNMTADLGTIEATVDAVIGYTPSVVSFYNGDADLAVALIHLAEDETNVLWARAGVEQDFRVVWIGLTDAESGNIFTDLSALRTPGDGVFDDVYNIREELNADLKYIVVQNSGACGVAYLMTSITQSFLDDYTVGVVRRSCATGYYSTGHEIGHNAGSAHDPDNASAALNPYAYGHRFVATEDGRTYRSAMAYAPGTRIQWFSNPDQLFRGTALGVAGARDNALSLREDGIPALSRARFSGDSPGGVVEPVSIGAYETHYEVAEGETIDIVFPFDRATEVTVALDVIDVPSLSAAEAGVDWTGQGFGEYHFGFYLQGWAYAGDDTLHIPFTALADNVTDEETENVLFSVWRVSGANAIVSNEAIHVRILNDSSVVVPPPTGPLLPEPVTNQGIVVTANGETTLNIEGSTPDKVQIQATFDPKAASPNTITIETVAGTAEPHIDYRPYKWMWTNMGLSGSGFKLTTYDGAEGWLLARVSIDDEHGFREGTAVINLGSEGQPVNQAPVLNPLDDFSLIEEDSLIVDIFGSDPDGEVVGHVFDGPGFISFGGSLVEMDQIDQRDGVEDSVEAMFLDPQIGDAGTYSCSLQLVDDEGALSNSVSFTVVVESLDPWIEWVEAETVYTFGPSIQRIKVREANGTEHEFDLVE